MRRVERSEGRAGKGDRLAMVTTDTIAGMDLRPGGIVHAAAVSGANVLRDMREAITNTIGGKMLRYEKLLDQTITRALETLEDNARAQGYEAVVGVRISHPVITDGAIEIVAIGTGVWTGAGDGGEAGLDDTTQT
jgi:uncharacterized protein YbjQ (UPF0145 family)